MKILVNQNVTTTETSEHIRTSTGQVHHSSQRRCPPVLTVNYSYEATLSGKLVRINQAGTHHARYNTLYEINTTYKGSG